MQDAKRARVLVAIAATILGFVLIIYGTFPELF